MIISTLKCIRCENSWIPRTENPVQCPRCKSTLWNKPRKRKTPRDDESDMIVIDEAPDILTSTVDTPHPELMKRLNDDAKVVRLTQIIDKSLCKQCGRAVNPKNKKCSAGHPN